MPWILVLSREAITDLSNNNMAMGNRNIMADISSRRNNMPSRRNNTHNNHTIRPPHKATRHRLSMIRVTRRSSFSSRSAW